MLANSYRTPSMWTYQWSVNPSEAGLQGYLAHEPLPPPQDPTVALCLGIYGDPRVVDIFMSEVPPKPKATTPEPCTVKTKSQKPNR